MPDSSKLVLASQEMARITIQAKEVVSQLRDFNDPEMAYALVYELRTRLGRVVAAIGQGVPASRSHSLASEILDKAAGK